jgi:hypothetical protein
MFINYGDLLFDFDKNNSWNILFCMQHYGMKTRLLDWTSSFAKAVYFANLKRKEGSTACIWILNPFSLNKIARERMDITNADTLFSIDSLPEICKDYTNYFEKTMNISSIALLPRKNNRRILAQDGVFTIQGKHNKPLNEEYPELVKNNKLIKIVLPWTTYNESMEYLELNGINTYSMMTDLEGLSKYIINDVLKYEFE